MTDHLTKEKRSWNMSRIKSKDSVPEIRVRKLLHSLGFRYKLYDPKLPGKPDLVFPKYKTVLFVHGCFWHRHKGCKYAYMPKTRQNFWKTKFNSNIERDIKVQKQLNSSGWKILIIWECELSEFETLINKLEYHL